MSARFVVGIDLGTTNSVVAYVDTSGLAADAEPGPAAVLGIPQLVKAGLAEPRDRLPSFLYLPAPKEFPEGSLRLPWGDETRAVGELARARGAEVPGRVVSSAKSWLCSVGLDPTQAALPWNA